MTTRHRRLVGRAHRRRAQGRRIQSTAVRGAFTQEYHPHLWDAFRASLVPVLEAWETIRATFRTAFRGVVAAMGRQDPSMYVLMPPPVRRPQGPLLHNGRKARRR